MFNKIKKNWLVIVAMLLLSVGLAACNQQQSAKEGASSQATATKEILENYIKAASQVKSAVVESNVDLSTKSKDGTLFSNKIKMNMESMVEPLKLKGQSVISMTGTPDFTVDVFVDQNQIYTKINLDASQPATWAKIDSQNTDSEYQQLKDIQKIAYSEDLLNFLKEQEKNIKVTTQDSSYVLEYTGSKEELKKILLHIFKTNKIEMNEADLAEVKIGDYVIKIVIDKATYNPKESVIELAAADSETDLSVKYDIKFTKVNELKDIERPADLPN